MRPRILIVEDDGPCRAIARRALDGRAEIDDAPSLGEARRRLSTDSYQVLLLDLHLGDGNGLDLLREVRAKGRNPQIVVMSGGDVLDQAVEAMRRGAIDYVAKPFDLVRLGASVDQALRVAALESENRHLRAEVEGADLERIVGRSPEIARLKGLVLDVAPLDIPVLLDGESGTGKELVARAIHYSSRRRAGPFVPINCAALPEALLESELFGNVKGAFTGADRARPGLVDQAADGTLFLDEIASTGQAFQSKVLRLLDQGTYRPVGGVDDRTATCRFVAATNRNLDELVRAGTFREDLYYRLNRFLIRLPPLRERSGDTLRLAEHFLTHFAVKLGKRLESYEPEATRRILEHGWPGNVRELRNVIERAAIVARGSRLQAADLLIDSLRSPPPPPPPTPPPGARGAPNAGASPSGAPPLIEIPDGGLDLEALERSIIEQALTKARFNKTEAAKSLRMSRSTLRYRMEKFGLS